MFLGEKTRKWIHWVEAEAGDERIEHREPLEIQEEWNTRGRSEGG